MKPMTEQQRKKIKTHIKNNLDISDLIKDYSIRGENLAGAQIKYLSRPNDDITGVNLSNTIIGAKGVINNISGCKGRNSNWNQCEVQGVMFARRCDFRNANFSGAILPNVEYQFTDFRYATFCETALRMGTDYGRGCKMDENFFRDLTRGWNIKVVFKTGTDKVF